MIKPISILCASLLLVSAANADQEHIDRYVALTSSQKSLDLGHLQGFVSIFEKLETENLAERIEQTYAEEFYFNDTFITLDKRQDLIEYLTLTADKATYVSTTVLDVMQSGEDVYVRWLLEMEFEVMGKARFSRSPGITHLRFDEQGLIVMHQDFWDSAGGFYQHLPVLGGLISWVAGKMHP